MASVSASSLALEMAGRAVRSADAGRDALAGVPRTGRTRPEQDCLFRLFFAGEDGGGRKAARVCDGPPGTCRKVFSWPPTGMMPVPGLAQVRAVGAFRSAAFQNVAGSVADRKIGGFLSSRNRVRFLSRKSSIKTNRFFPPFRMFSSRESCGQRRKTKRKLRF